MVKGHFVSLIDKLLNQADATLLPQSIEVVLPPTGNRSSIECLRTIALDGQSKAPIIRSIHPSKMEDV